MVTVVHSVSGLHGKPTGLSSPLYFLTSNLQLLGTQAAGLRPHSELTKSRSLEVRARHLQSQIPAQAPIAVVWELGAGPPGNRIQVSIPQPVSHHGLPLKAQPWLVQKFASYLQSKFKTCL